MNELIKITESDEKEFISIDELRKFNATDDVILSVGFAIKCMYSVSDACKIIYRLALIIATDTFCIKYKCDKDVLAFKTIDNIDYVAIDFMFNKTIPIDLLIFECFAENLHQLPYSFKQNNVRYVSLSCLKILIDLDLSFIHTKINKESDQYTYIMFDELSGFYKIGKSKDIAIRERTLSAQIPKIKTILSLNYNIESELHKYYNNKRYRGEWFALTANDILDIISIYGFKKY